MARTFNCGLGMVLVVAADRVTEVISLIPCGEAQQVGHLVAREEGLTRFDVFLLLLSLISIPVFPMIPYFGENLMI